MQEPRDTSTTQPAMFLYSKYASLQDPNSTAKSSSLLAHSGLLLAFLLSILCRCKYSQLRNSHIFFMRWLFHRLIFLISRKIFMILSTSFQAPASGSLSNLFPSMIILESRVIIFEFQDGDSEECNSFDCVKVWHNLHFFQVFCSQPISAGW